MVVSTLQSLASLLVLKSTENVWLVDFDQCQNEFVQIFFRECSLGGIFLAGALQKKTRLRMVQDIHQRFSG